MFPAGQCKATGGKEPPFTEHYLKTVYDLSRTFAFGSVPRSDLIQEGNVALVLALEELKFSGKLEDYQNFLYEKIREAMEDALSEGQDLKDMGDKVAQKVNHLSEAVHNLEEDLEHKVSVVSFPLIWICRWKRYGIFSVWPAMRLM